MLNKADEAEWDPGPYNTFKGVPTKSGLVVAFFHRTGCGLVRISACNCFNLPAQQQNVGGAQGAR